MNRTFLLLLLLLTLVLPVPARAGDYDWAVAKLAREAYDTVKTAGMFTVGGIGYACSPSREETAFRQLLKQPEALARCQKLLGEATPSGRLYGLLGLHLLDQHAFQAALPRFRDSKTDIETMHGCLISRTTVAEVAGQIEKGELK